MAYGRLAGSMASMALKASPVGGALSLARGLTSKIPGLSGLLGGMSASQKRLKSRARLDRLLASAAKGTLSARQLQRLQNKAKGPYAKQAAKAQAALASLSRGNRTQSSGGSPSVGAGPMSLAYARPKGTGVRYGGFTVRRIKGSKKKRVTTSRGRTVKVRTSKMPPALAAYWRARRAKRRAARTLAK